MVTSTWRSSSTIWRTFCLGLHYGDVIMGLIAFQITSLIIVYSTVYSDADRRKHQTSASPGTGEFPAQMASNAENVSIWWRHHEYVKTGPRMNDEIIIIHKPYVACLTHVSMQYSLMTTEVWYPICPKVRICYFSCLMLFFIFRGVVPYLTATYYVKHKLGTSISSSLSSQSRDAHNALKWKSIYFSTMSIYLNDNESFQCSTGKNLEICSCVSDSSEYMACIPPA